MIIAGNNIYSAISANGSIVQASAPAILHAITINTPGVGANLLTVQDGPGGATIAQLATTVGPVTLFYDVSTSIGLSTSIAGGTVAQITLSYSRQS